MECRGKNKRKRKFCPSAAFISQVKTTQNTREQEQQYATNITTKYHKDQNLQRPKTAPPATAATTQNNYRYSVFAIKDGRNRQENLVYNNQQSSIGPPCTMGYKQKQAMW
eukprot:6775403-Ditylum_brightwellii.AAC.1